MAFKFTIFRCYWLLPINPLDYVLTFVVKKSSRTIDI